MRMRKWAAGLALLCLVTEPLAAQDLKEVRVNGARLWEHLMRLGQIGRTPAGGVSRLAYTEADRQGRAFVAELMRQAGMTVRIDAAGNIIGRYPGRHDDRPPIAMGSHIDSVPEGGAFDGCLGVLAAIEVVRTLAERGIRLAHPLEVLVFANEEGGLVGSRALVGALTPEILAQRSQSGVLVSEGIRAIGGDPDRLPEARRRPGDYTAYLELHIEQGGLLEREGASIGIVEGIVGIRWWDVLVEGFANHAGTTPMRERRDALVAAAEFVLAVHRLMLQTPGRQVGTVGRLEVEPGARNVIPARVRMSLEIRDLEMAKIDSLFVVLQAEAEAIARRTGTRFFFRPAPTVSVAVPTHPELRLRIREAAERLGLSYRFMPSGAGHDAQNMAQLAPMGMIFIPSVGGISHAPQEYSRPEDVARGANVLLQTILLLDQRPPGR
ncbi:MAG: Zn-dependent hydrolase [Bacteroidetes bacterium]|nr:Zn-dependent hydrolase [Rhodothermia bacterium]MCS7154469.1 Zn-dependent hydrolase [Bacteroidota bacterium]MCX7906842.1 Zn-dependent hydrolase [Bacteroidota bacterium]MDW8136879.1 Zn-dependent hydrolase [Bacteroidota bacterium]MDW8285251.1 Zn-dependent hydrolase [Bacteroidota bacterium]